MIKIPMKQTLESASRAIEARCDEIIEASQDSSRDPGECFTTKEIQKNIDLCIGFLRAVAALDKPEKLISAADTLARLEEKVIAADYALAERMTCNPHTITCIIRCEEFVLDLMIEGNPFLLSAAKFIAKVPIILPHILRAAFTDIQHQLAESGGANQQKRPLLVQLVKSNGRSARKRDDWRKDDPAILKRRDDTKRVLAEIRKRHKGKGGSFSTVIEKMKRDPVWSARMGHRNAETWRSEAIKRGK